MSEATDTKTIWTAWHGMFCPRFARDLALLVTITGICRLPEMMSTPETLPISTLGMPMPTTGDDASAGRSRTPWRSFRNLLGWGDTNQIET